MAGKIYVGIGGWTFEPWRGVFYPDDLAQKRELEYASRKLSSIEINGTYYSSFKPASWAKWRDETPASFVFAVKGSRYVTNRSVLAEAGESIERFLKSGVTEMGDKLGPLLWQFAPFKKFNPADFGAFLELLPEKFDGRKLRHVVEVRHDSFKVPEFIALLRKFNIGVVFTDHETYPNIADVTADFVYARLQQGEDSIETAYPPKQIKEWAGRLRNWADGKAPKDLPVVDAKAKPKAMPRDVFAYVIHEGKVRAPAAAMALIEKLTE